VKKNHSLSLCRTIQRASLCGDETIQQWGETSSFQNKSNRTRIQVPCLGQKEAVPIQVTLMPFDPNVNRKQDKIKVLSVLAPEGDFKIKNLVSLNFVRVN
jgi:hypothetical protein